METETVRLIPHPFRATSNLPAQYPVFITADFEPKEPGRLTARNLLLSGDNPHRDRARARFWITPAGLLARQP